MTQKTAMQTLRDEVKEEYESCGRIRLAWLLHRIIELEATERQQHIETFNAGTKARYIKGAKSLGLKTLPEGVETGEQYYEQTFGNSPSPSK